MMVTSANSLGCADPKRFDCDFDNVFLLLFCERVSKYNYKRAIDQSIRSIDRWMDERTHGRTDTQMDGWMDGWMDR